MKKITDVIYDMGLVSVSSYKHYWQKPTQYGDKFVQKIKKVQRSKNKTMRKDRFLAISQSLHFGDNNETYNQIRKVKYLADHLNNAIEDIHEPEDRLSFDKSLVIFLKVQKKSSNRYFCEKFKDNPASCVDPSFRVYHQQRVENNASSSKDENIMIPLTNVFYNNKIKIEKLKQ